MQSTKYKKTTFEWLYIYLSFKVQSLTNIKCAIKCWNNDIIPI